MVSSSPVPKVVHFFDCAEVGKTLVKYGRAEGYRWWYRPELPPSLRVGDAAPKHPALARRSWQVRRTIEALRADIMHVHFGTRGGVANNRPVIPFVMHWHGTDIRTNLYNPATRANVLWGADHAAKVVYATPDLREHAQKVRPDAIYLPSIIDFSELPAWTPAGAPKVVFSSRWEDSKGGAKQLRLLSGLRQALGPDVVIEGLDWGDLAAEASKLGVRLVPRMPKQKYLAWMSTAHCVIGQSSGVMGTSELQAVAMGAPVVMHIGEGFYPSNPLLSAPGDDDLISHVRRILADPISVSKEVAGREWAERYHGPHIIVQQLADIYRSIS